MVIGFISVRPTLMIGSIKGESKLGKKSKQRLQIIFSEEETDEFNAGKISKKYSGYPFGYPEKKNPRLAWVSRAKTYPEPESNRHELAFIGF